MEKYDAIIIGFGKGGKTLAASLAAHGKKVAMVERSDKMYGGTCINTGCIPTKALIYRAAAAPGNETSFEERQAFYRRAIAEKNEITADLRGRNYRNLADRENITVITGEASFTGKDIVRVTTAEGSRTLTAPEIFINTGAVTALPPIDGLAGNRRVYDSASLMELDELPRRLAIVGGGYIGLEYASMYASFGSRITVLEGQSELIPREDRDVAEAVRKALESKGIVFRLNAQVQTVEDAGDRAVLRCRDAAADTAYSVEADAVLVAVGRRPDTDALNLQAAGVETNRRGAIVVDEHLRTANPHIHALGDVTGGLQFTYISLDDYRIVADELFGEGKRTTNRGPVSYSVFIDPPLSHVGLHEHEAKARGLHYTVKKIPVASIPRARIQGLNPPGLLKALTDPDTGEILGCTLFCPASTEVINTVSVAIKAGLKASFLRDFIFTHPTMSEALNDLFGS